MSSNKKKNKMERGLTNRHVQVMAIAGTIGTGLFLGAGRSISLTGPSIILIYMITGTFMFLMMRAVGEMLYQDPEQHTFINFITRHLGKGWGYFSVWSYWLSVVFIGMAEITAISDYVRFWFPTWPSWMIQLVFLTILALVNLIAVKLFGEVEFWFAMVKMVLTGFKTPHGVASLANISDQFSLFPNGVMNFVMAFQMVFFAYLMIEFIGVTTSETKNPRQVLPKAVKEIPLRIIFFYGGALIAIMAIIPWSYLNSSDSPFVTVFELAGIKWAAALINFVVLTSAASALNSTLYSTGRHLYQIAHDSPNRFLKAIKVDTLSRHNVPQNAIIASAILIALAAFINVLPGVSDAFALITASSSGVYIAIYILIMVAHLKYRKSQDFMADGYLMPQYRLLNPLTILFFVFVFVTLFLQESTFMGAVGSAIWILVFGIYSQWKFRK